MNGNGTKQGAANSPWIAHVKSYMSAHNCSYKDALKRASASYERGAVGTKRVASSRATAYVARASADPRRTAARDRARAMTNDVAERIYAKKISRMTAAQNAKARRLESARMTISV